MNAAAFRRGDAITRLENYAPVIVEHLALVAWFPTHTANNHWQAELRGFLGALKRYDSAKSGRHNFTKEIVIMTLMDMIRTEDERDYVLIGVESHGGSVPSEPDWDLVYKSIEDFALKLVK